MDSLMNLAKVLGSKNAGPFYITFDIMFDEEKTFQRVKESGIITRKLISELYHVAEEEVSIIDYDAANSIKVTIPRKYASGDLHDSDIYGCQQHAPLANVQVP